MGHLSSPLSRSERLLPLESVEVLNATNSVRLLILHHEDEHDVDSNGMSRSRRLHEHVSVYWSQSFVHRQYNHKLLQEVQPTRGPIGFAGFPQIVPSGRRRGSQAGHSTAATSSEASGTSREAVQLPEAAIPTPSALLPSPMERSWLPPRSLATWNWIRLVAPYERLLCPSLLFSSLLSPSLGECTPLCHGTQPPSSQPTATPSVASSMATASLTVPANWSVPLCQALWSLHITAARASLPVQEVYVFCAGTMIYLDAVVAAGRVWSELEGLWGTDLGRSAGGAACGGGGGATAGGATGDLHRDVYAMKCDSDGDTRLKSIRELLSQPPQTYATAMQQVRVLLEALTTTVTPAAHHARISEASPAPLPLVPWLLACMENETWTSEPPDAEKESSAIDDTTVSSNVVVQVLKYAVKEWLSRRGATVTATAPAGGRAVSLPPRDLDIQTEAPRDTSDSTQLSPSSSGTPLSPVAGSAVAARRSMTSASSSFDAFQPRDTPRARHPFGLPPLPQDPALLVFAVVWRRTIRQCATSPDTLRQRLRPIILGLLGQRCEEVLRETREQDRIQQLQLPGEALESETLSSRIVELQSPQLGWQPETATAPAVPLAVLGQRSTSPACPSATSSTPPGTGRLVASESSPTPPLSHALSAPPLLTCDPGAVSFRILGPGSGEWLTSTGGGAWSGFRGDLYRCVGPPTPPPAVPSVLPTQGAHKVSGDRAARRTRRSGILPTTPDISAAPREKLVEPFMDGALEIEDGDLRGHHSFQTLASAPLSVTRSSPPQPLYTTEELADLLCRLGAALPRYATEVSGIRLSAAAEDFTKEVLQRCCLPLLLASQKRGVQEWGIRAWMRGIALTVVDNSGAELRVTTPAKLVEMGWQQAQTAGGAEAYAMAAALQLVMHGGMSEALAFIEHLRKRKDCPVRWLPVRRLASSNSGSVTVAHSAPVSASQPLATAVEAVLLRRAEESAMFRVFQSHPLALQLSGCGVQRLALPLSGPTLRRDTHHSGTVNPHVTGSCTLLLVRTCGVAAEWDLKECYERPKYRRLREPRRLTSALPLANTAGDITRSTARWLPLPPELNSAIERVSLRHVRGMLQHYHQSLCKRSSFLTEVSPAAAGIIKDPSATALTAGRTRHGRKRTRTEEEGRCAKETASAALQTHFSTGGDAVAKHSATGVASLPDAQVSAQPTQVGDTAVSSALTTLFPIDRVVLMYVLQHHPQYHHQVLGCGIKEVYVSTAAEDASVPAEKNIVGERSPVVSHDASDYADIAASVTAAPLEAPAGSTSALPDRPTLIVERVCGQRVVVDIEACYNKRQDGCPLQPPVILL